MYRDHKNIYVIKLSLNYNHAMHKTNKQNILVYTLNILLEFKYSFYLMNKLIYRVIFYFLIVF